MRTKIFTEEADEEHQILYPAILSDEEYAELEARPGYQTRSGTCPTCKSTQPVKKVGTFRCRGSEHVCPIDFDNKCLQWKYWRMYELSNIDDGYMRLRWETMEEKQPEAKELIDQYVSHLPNMCDQGVGLYIYGDLGIGKTFCATHILKEAAKLDHHEVRYRGYFVSFQEVLDSINDTWLSERMKHTNLLVIDDVIAGFSSKAADFYARELETVTRYRGNNRLPTVITSNISWEKLHQLYPRVFSVLSDSVQPIELAGGEDSRIERGITSNFDAALNNEVDPIT